MRGKRRRVNGGKDRIGKEEGSTEGRNRDTPIG
jgi:hypothetical protein